MQDLEFEKSLYDILDIYTENGEYDLDGDEIDNLVNHLRNELNLICGNITNDEYWKLENADIISKIYQYITSDTHKIEDFTDLEICSEVDLAMTEDKVIELLKNGLAYYELEKMFEEMNSENIDLVKWGHLAIKQLHDGTIE
jgi:hypothetical protein